MATDAPPALEHQLQPPPASPDGAPDSAAKPPVKRSWRRKYRKMRVRFEDTMNTSNTLIKDEFKAMALARRLQEQNDQILDLLLDMNDTARLPAHLRVDLRELSEPEAAVPSLESDPDPNAIQLRLQELRTALSSGEISAEAYTREADQLHNAQPLRTNRSLAALETKVPHTTQPPEPPVDGIDLSEHAPGYMSPAHEEEYLLAMDVALGDPALYDPARPPRISTAQPAPTEKELTVRNPDSVYNWLRKNQPQVFLQDKDPQQAENMSEKSSARTGGRGGKRQSAAVGTPGPKTEHDDDDGFIPETGTGTGKGRRAKGEDDSAYRPKGGSSRGAKRKREDGDPVGKGGRKKNRASAGTAG